MGNSTTHPTVHLWGFSTKLYLDDRVMLTRMWADEGGGASSLHLHHNRGNLFVVQKGLILVVTETPFGQLVNCYVTANHSLMVPAGIKHRLVVPEPMEGFEFYQAVEGTVMDPNDIHRFDEGWRPGDKQEE